MNVPCDSNTLFTERLLMRDRQRAEFIATVSHDLKTPLNAIVGFTSVLLQDAGDPQSERNRQLNLVYSSAHHLLERIDGILELYRMEGGKIKKSQAWFSPLETILQAVEPLRPLMTSNGLLLEIARELFPARLNSDVRLFQRILKELLSNAAKFTKRGRIELTATSEPSLLPDRQILRFHVSDTGIGFKAEIFDTLFQSLKPGGSALDRSYAGLGLGLALCREAALLLGGWIEVKTNPTQGCSFSLALDLPAKDAVFSK
jgi:signal transduction histidine kinase